MATRFVRREITKDHDYAASSNGDVFSYPPRRLAWHHVGTVPVYTVRVDCDPSYGSHEYLAPAFLAVLAEATGRDPLTGPPRTRRGKSDYGPPPWRSWSYGNSKYGLKARGEPIETGQGVHGENTRWTFRGLPEGLKIHGLTNSDRRRSVSTAEIRMETYGYTDVAQLEAVFRSQLSSMIAP